MVRFPNRTDAECISNYRIYYKSAVFAVVWFIAPLSESRILTGYVDDADYLLSESRILTGYVDDADYLLSESRILTEDAEDADWESVISSYLLRGRFLFPAMPAGVLAMRWCLPVTQHNRNHSYVWI